MQKGLSPHSIGSFLSTNETSSELMKNSQDGMENLHDSVENLLGGVENPHMVWRISMVLPRLLKEGMENLQGGLENPNPRLDVV